MSLNRVASLESFADLPTRRRGSDASHSSLRPRKLSFNPLPQEWAQQQQQQPKSDSPHRHDQEPVSAFEVPEWKRIRELLPPVVDARS